MTSPFQLPGMPGVEAGSIFCIGRNYVEHAKELNNPVPTSPIIFLKPRNSLVYEGGTIVLPRQSADVHHEVELVLLIGSKASNVSEADARGVISGIGVGIDLTARDLQQKAKDKGHPWTVAKGFDTFAPLGNLIPLGDDIDLASITMDLKVNGQTRQHGTTADMIFPCTHLIATLSSMFTLYPGDLIYTGTPEGVSAIRSGDRLEAQLVGLGSHFVIDVA